MIVVVPSVHHTGTKLVYQDILRELREIEPEDKQETGYGKVRIHIEEKFLNDLHWWCSRHPIIVPLRHPREVAIGWKARMKRREELGEQWQMLKEEIDPYEPYYLPIDSPNRNAILRSISTSLNMPLTTHWPKIGNTITEKFDLDDKDEWMLKGWMEDGFFEQFGYS